MSIMLSPQRENLYMELASEIGNTPLYRVGLRFPHGNSVFAKKENTRGKIQGKYVSNSDPS